jgi:2-polyprenyl-6-methoxyphenol hydroxylase-like FAD-dependent oxidoreductase
MRVAINGAGIAGTALAYWLIRMGHEVLLVERAPEIRTGGYILNLWRIGYDAAEKMGVLPRLLELQYQTDELRMVDRHGRTRGGYPSRVLLDLAKGRISTLDLALAQYQERIKPYAARKQKYAESLVPSFVPRTAHGVSIRDFATLLMRLPVFPRLLMGRYFHDEMELPDYAI